MYFKKFIQELAQSRRAQKNHLGVRAELHDVHSAAMGGMVPVSVLVSGQNPAAVFVHLDGGVGDRESLIKRQALIADLSALGIVPQALHISFSGGSSEFYGGSWEAWILEDLPTWIELHFGVRPCADNTVLTGVSAGGHGALKVAFKHPERFKAVAALEPVVMPCRDWPEQHTRASWWMLQASAQAVWGEPFPENFLAEQPVNIALANAGVIQAAGLDIYLEVGDEDMLNLHDGGEFLHRALWEADIPHEYHQVRWADHGGHSLEDRLVEALAFLAASLGGGRRQSRDDELTEAEQVFVNYVLSGGPVRGEPVPENASQGTIDTELSVMNKLWQPLRELAVAQDQNMGRHYGQLPPIKDQGKSR